MASSPRFDRPADVPVAEDDERAVPAPKAALRPAALARRPAAVPLGTAVLTAVIVGFRVSRPELWRDELATWSASTRTLPQLWHLLHHTDFVLGLYYLGLHVWMDVFGDSVTAMRFPSLIAMAITAAVVALIGRRLAGNTAGLASGVIFAIIPAVSRFGQEARPYAFAALFSALATLALLRALESPDWRRSGWWRWALYALAMAAAGAASLVTLALFAGHAVGVLVLRGRRTGAAAVAGFVACGVLAVIIDSPLILVGHRQAAAELDTSARPLLSDLWHVWPQLFSSGPVSVVVIVLAVLGLAAPAYRRPAGFTLAAGLVPVLAVWVVSQGSTPYWNSRYLLFTVPIWAVAAGCGAATLPAALSAHTDRVRAGFARAVRYGVVVLAVVLVGVAGAGAQAAVRQPLAHNWSSYPDPSADFPVGYQAAADILAAREQPGDGIAYQVSDDARWAVDFGIPYYLGRQSAPRVVFQSETPQQAGLLRPVECAQPAACLYGLNRIWVVYIEHLLNSGRGGTPFQALQPNQAAVLRTDGYAVSWSETYQGVTVALLIRSLGSTHMKALVLAGGSGTRLRPITHTSAKQLVPVANKPVLFYGLEAIADAGITQVGIVVGDTAPAIRAAVGDGSAFGLEVTYIPQEAPLGLAHAVAIARDYLGDDDFVMYLGDNFIVGGITPLVEEFRRSRPAAHIMLQRVPDPRQFGVAELDADGQVIGLEEKPAAPKSDLALVGVYLFTPAVHEAVASLKPSARGELEITEAISALIDTGQPVTPTIITGYWKDTGNVADMLEVNRLVLESLEPSVGGDVDASSELIGRVAIGPGAKVTASRIVGPVVIGPGTEVSGSYIGPFTSIGPDCLIADSEIDYSIVLRGASIRGVSRIESSLIGHEARVLTAPAVRKAHQLVLGDHSRVQISSS